MKGTVFTMEENLDEEFFVEMLNSKKGELAIKQAEKFKEIMCWYGCAIREVRTKLEVLNDEFQNTTERNPIDNIKARIKKPMSIYEKLIRRGFPVTLDSILYNLHDVAGIRVICPFIDDIYTVADMLIAQDDITLIQRKDYIKNPKPNGYRSLHLVVEVPIFLGSDSNNCYEFLGKPRTPDSLQEKSGRCRGCGLSTYKLCKCYLRN